MQATGAKIHRERFWGELPNSAWSQLAFSGSFDSAVACAPAALRMTRGRVHERRQALKPAGRQDEVADGMLDKREFSEIAIGNFAAVREGERQVFIGDGQGHAVRG